MAPAAYVSWAQRKCEEFGVSFDGTPEAIEAMIRDGCSARGDLFLDFAVAGNILSRPGLNALNREAELDPRISHILFPRRDRLARPDDPIDAVKIENLLRQNGITLVFMDRILPPLRKGQRPAISDQILAVLDYNNAGEFRRELAQKILMAQILLAKAGYSTGGRPPFAFQRWLVKEDGTPVRQLAEGERVRMRGHHVVWLPGAEEEIALIRRILTMLETMPASRVAAKLTAEGIPSPDAGRCRTDSGVQHRVSGVWHQTTIVNIARNPLLMAVCTYGRRSMGDQLRYSPDGPRELEDADYRGDEKPKVIRNRDKDVTLAPARFEPIVAPKRHRALLAELDRRGASQRGKPRSKNPAENPLGCRVTDINCTWPMYRTPYLKSFRYTCGLYQQSHAQACAHNQVDGPTATAFVLSCLRQRLLSPTLLSKVEQRVAEIARSRVASSRQTSPELKDTQAQLARLVEDLEKISGNMALADSPDQYKAMATVFDELKQRHAALETEIAATKKKVNVSSTDIDAEISAAMGTINRLTELVAEPNGFEAAREIFDLTNVRLFLKFRPVQVKKRVLNKLIGGVVTFGSAPPPVSRYEGPTSRETIKGSAASSATEPGGCTPPTPPKRIGSGEEGKSLGNVSRGDWI